ncbi:MAG TPA: alanine--tRNA ligase [Thermodesulfobacteriaceae bacterium]|nr:alanine--tRNA ligase [Thermodesulfobacteriaceae bacterium]
MTGAWIRSLFLDYFRGKNHEVVPSSSLVPADDPTLLFTNAGMVQFKKVFLGEETRSYTRAASCQKCVRAGGKHNDLENVGYTARHHTFFEMLGNFSFGDYFKTEAIEYAWEFLTRVLELPREKLWVTVFRDDDEAATLWPQITGIDPDRVIRLGEKDNFWAMGDTGPCGPCSEILIDQGPEVGCRRPDCRAGCNCDRYLELWNLVFMQFFRDAGGGMNPLPEPCIDTGMGLERIAAVCQGKVTNFDSDIFAGLIEHVCRLSGSIYGQDERADVALKVIADHARAAAFLTADGVMPSNEGRGYVLRRIIRRAVRYGRVLRLRGPFLASTADVVVREMGDVYPELSRASAFLGRTVEHEEVRFAETLEFGLGMLDHEIRRIKAGRDGRGKIIPGDFIFKLYDTYGFPIDIVQDVAIEEGLTVDRAGFEEAMMRQKERSRKARRETVTEELPAVYRELLNSGQGGTFTGYDMLSCSSNVLALVQDSAPVLEACAGWAGELVVSETPFYAESGGQTGDAGIVRWSGGEAEVLDTYHRGDLIVHSVKIRKGCLGPGDEVRLEVLEGRRINTARNHTATHLLHAALGKVLGDHVKQSGSLVTDHRLRFDFSHFSSMTAEEIRQVEDLVNRQIRADQAISTEVLSYKEAMERGAVALFGEKYGDQVRMVTIPDFSMELCGGTHIGRTGQIGLFKIVSESSVASGVRRIEACTAQEAVNVVHGLEDTIGSIADRLKCPKAEILGRIQKLLERVKAQDRTLQDLERERAVSSLDELVSSTRQVDGIRVLSARVDVEDPAALRGLGDRLRDRIGSGVVVLGAESRGKALLLALVTRDLAGRVHAGKLISEIAKRVGGGGGGRSDMAQAGGSRPENLSEALESVYRLLECR